MCPEHSNLPILPHRHTCTLLWAISPGVGQLIASPKSPTCKTHSMRALGWPCLCHSAPHPTYNSRKRSEATIRLSTKPSTLEAWRAPPLQRRSRTTRKLRRGHHLFLQESPLRLLRSPYLAAFALFRNCRPHHFGWSRMFCGNKKGEVVMQNPWTEATTSSSPSFPSLHHQIMCRFPKEGDVMKRVRTQQQLYQPLRSNHRK